MNESAKDRSRVRAWLSEKLLKKGRWIFPLILAAGIALDLSAIWSVTWLPMGDLGGWIELMDVMARHDDPSTAYGEAYELPSRLEPNMLSLGLAWLLGSIFRADTLAKLLLSMYAIALPLSLLAVCLAFGRSKWLALFSLPMVFNGPFLVGLLNYLLALPLVFLSIALARGHAIRGRPWRGLVLAACLVALYFAHVLGFIFGWPICLAVLLLSTKPRRYHLRLWPLLPPVPLFAIWTWRKFVALEATSAGVTFGTSSGLDLNYPPLDRYFANLHPWAMRYFRDGTEEVFVIILILAWLWLIAQAQAASPPRRDDGGVLGFLRSRSLEMITLCCTIAYFALPTSMNQLGLIAERVVIIIALLLTAWPLVNFKTWSTRIVLVPLTAAAIAYPLLVREKFQTFERDLVGDLPRAIAELPDRTKLAYILWDKGNSLTHFGTLWHIPQAINALENGGTTDEGFAVRPYTAVQFKKGQTPKRLPDEFWKSSHLRDYDYVLLLCPWEPMRPLKRKETLELTFHDGLWWLFKVLDQPDAKR